MYEANNINEKFGQEYISGWAKSSMRKMFGMPDSEEKRMVNEVPS